MVVCATLLQLSFQFATQPDKFLIALDYLTETFTGDEVAIQIQKKRWETQMRVVAELRDNVQAHTRLRDKARAAVRNATEAVAGEDGLFETIGEAFFSSGPEEDELIEARQRAATEAKEWADADLQKSESTLRTSIDALNQATDDYILAIRQQLNRRTRIDQCRIHVKDNILYYMQAIWMHEPPDQRYFRIYKKEVDWYPSSLASFSASKAVTDERPGMSMTDIIPEHGLLEAIEADGVGFMGMGGSTTDWGLLADIDPDSMEPEKRLLYEIADIDNLIGFKGNFAMFPLKKRNALTDTMSTAFLDDYFGVWDPDVFGEIPTPTEAVRIVQCAWKSTDDDEKALLTKWLTTVLDIQKRSSEKIVVPTGELFIEALTGKHPLLEDFKLQHRGLDKDVAAAQVSKQYLEAVRYAARLQNGLFDDPDVEKKINTVDDSTTTINE